MAFPSSGRRLAPRFSAGGITGRMYRGVMGSGGIWILKLLITFALAAALGRLLGTSGYGLYAYAVSWVAFLATSGNMGFSVLATRELATARVTADPAKAAHVLAWFPRAVFCSSGLLAVLFAAVLWLTGDAVAGDAQRDALLLAVVAIPLLAQVELLQGQLRGLERPTQGQFVLFVAVPGATLLVFSATLLFTEADPYLAVLSYVTGLGGVALLGRWLLARSGMRARDADASERTRGWLRSAAIVGANKVAASANEQLPLILTGLLASSAEVGLLDIARKFSLFAAVGLNIVSIPLGPIAAELHATGKRERLEQLAIKAARVGLVGSLAIALTYVVAGPWLLGLIGPEFGAAYAALLILCVGQLANNAAGPVRVLLNMSGHEREASRGIVLSLVLNGALALALVPWIGHLGAAISATAGLIAWNLVLLGRARAVLGISAHAFNMR